MQTMTDESQVDDHPIVVRDEMDSGDVVFRGWLRDFIEANAESGEDWEAASAILKRDRRVWIGGGAAPLLCIFSA